MMKESFGWKFKPEIDYMTRTEQNYFHQMVEAGAITIFKLARCKNCNKYIPKTKNYCSLDCKEKKEGTEAENDSE